MDMAIWAELKININIIKLKKDKYIFIFLKKIFI